MDYEIQRCTRHCSKTDRELKPGETYYSVLVAEGADLTRYDYAAEAWEGPPEKAVGWWQAEIPDRTTKRMQWAPNDVMLEFFDELADQPERRDMYYVLSLLLVRRRVMRLEDSEKDEGGNEVLVLYCPRRDATYQVPVSTPEKSRIDEIQQEIAQLLQ